MCEILDDLKMRFETHHDIYLPAGHCWYLTYTLDFYLKKSEQKRDLISTLDLWDVLDGISEGCSMIVYFYIWNLSWVNIFGIEETTKYCEKIGGIYYYYYFLFMEASLCCDVFLCNFGISLYRLFCICINQFCFSVTFHVCTCTPAFLYPLPF